MSTLQISFRCLVAVLSLSLFTSVSVAADNAYNKAPEVITSKCAAYMDSFDEGLTKLLAEQSPATYATVAEPLDDLMMRFYDDLLHDYLMQNAHPDEAVRKASTDCALKGFEVLSSLNANRDLYERIAKIDTKTLAAEKRFTVEYWLESFRMSGIGEDKATRDKIEQLNNEISEISNTFNININNAVGTLLVKPERLAGLPQDYLDAHPVDENGLVKITTATPDVFPIYTYVHDRELRKEITLLRGVRAYPENQAVLLNLVEKRQELATTLGHKHFAHYDMLGTMVKNPDNAIAFAAKLSAAIKEPVQKEKARMLKRMQLIVPEAKEVRSWDASYVANIIREQEYQLDAKEVREYFHYDKVRDGIIRLSEDLFDLSIKAVDAPVWHNSVEAYEVFDNDVLIGRIFLDSHPREGKFTHAAQFGIKMGKKDIEIPAGALLQNFPKGLMEHDDVETFLHEFGHLLHWVFAGQNDIANSRFQNESDFGEAPSTMLEEWVWDYNTLSDFATNAEGETIPKELVAKMNRARYFGQALGVAGQLAYTALSLELYNRDPKGLNLEAFEKDILERYAPYGYTEGTYMHTSFGHLGGYGSKYYTYQWSESIAEELLSRFKKEGMRNKKTAADYRNLILAKTGTKPAGELVRDFLGREYTVEAYANRLSKSE